jgi:hypothetical protein
MLASIVASKTARLITACVCPVVGAGTLTMAVPKVRNAVHKATAPREYALPKTRERIAEPVSAVAPCTTIGATPLSAGFIEEPSIFPPSTPPGIGTPLLPVAVSGPGGKEPITDGPGGPATPPFTGGVPEPHVWLQLLVGFTLVGGAVRMARKKPTEEEQELMARVDELKKDARL